MTAASDSNVNALVRRETAPVRAPDVITTLAEIERVAKACAASGYYKDVRDVSQAVVKMLAGREMGIGPIQALAGIHIVEGKPSAGASLIAGNVKRSGRYDYRVVERTNVRCELEWFDRGEPVGRSEFTLDDAKRAGLAGRANWSKYPRAMLFARALTEGVRVYCPDAASGIIYTPEELAPQVLMTEDAQPALPRDVTPEPTPEYQDPRDVTRDPTGYQPEGHDPNAELEPPGYDPRTEPAQDVETAPPASASGGFRGELFPFGKHKGKTWGWFAEGSPGGEREGYLRWAIGHDDGKYPQTLSRMQQVLAMIGTKAVAEPNPEAEAHRDAAADAAF